MKERKGKARLFFFFNIFSHVSSPKLSPYLLENGSFKRCHYFYTV